MQSIGWILIRQQKKASIDKILSAFRRGKTNILIGTQLVCKRSGFFQTWAWLASFSADISLNIPDFRSAERTFQLITQAAGRAGRGDTPGQVLIQSYNPEHYSIITASEHDYESFYRAESTIRRQIGYPPYSDLIQVVLSSAREQEAYEICGKTAADFISGVGKSEEQYVFGPQAAPMNKNQRSVPLSIVNKMLPWEKKGILQDFK